MKDSKVLVTAYMLFGSYVRPILDCGTVVFSPHTEKDIASLEEKIKNNLTRETLIRRGGFVTATFQVIA